MNPASIIARKRDGHALTHGQIADFISGFARGEIPDYQMSALAMAIYLRGMTSAETTSLTEVMLASGTRLSWSTSDPDAVDKHSTGGIGDKVSLILAPLLASCEVIVPMISGRGLGATGGTLDKLESIPGFRTDLSLAEVQRICRQIGCVITGASDELAPADKKLYALRDVTATVASIPLITASIMSKKLAEGLTSLVLDVKVGSGAFMKSLPQARQLAQSLVDVGRNMGVSTSALLTDMNQPLGRMVGNALEVDEAIATLQGDGPADLVEATTALGGELLRSTQRAPSRDAGAQQLRQRLQSGAAWEKFEAMVAAQGGDCHAPRPRAPESEIAAARDGFLTQVDAEALGMVVIHLDGGRRLISDPIDHRTGFEMCARLGDRLTTGQPVARLFAPPDKKDEATAMFTAALTIDDAAVEPTRLIVDEL